jgi:plasmid maintenance system antidote protein VapI
VTHTVAMTYDPDWVVHPGETLAEWLQYARMDAGIAVALYGFDETEIAGVLDGTVEIDEDLAAKLADLTGIPARFWLALEHNFRVGIAAGKTWCGNEVEDGEDADAGVPEDEEAKG